ncbi:hypothetical protein QUA38_20155 [Microcoleus sp. Pol12B4]
MQVISLLHDEVRSADSYLHKKYPPRLAAQRRNNQKVGNTDSRLF